MPGPRRRRRDVLALSGAAVAALAVSATPTAAAKRSTGPLQQQVDLIHDSGAVGVHAEVTASGTRQIAYAGTAARNARHPMPRNGTFRIGSATKTFTATVVLHLVGEGRMSLEDTVERWLPGVVRGHGNDGRRITVRQLLQHTSGVPDVGPRIPALTTAEGYRAERFRTYTPEELVRLAMRQPPTFCAGKGWSYSNTNYVLAAMVIHAVAGRRWAEEVRDRIIRRLDLRDTSAPGVSPSIAGPHAHAYAKFPTGTGTEVDVTELNSTMAIGSGALISTVHDLNRFYAALLGGRLLAPAQLDEMTTTVPAPELGVRYGLGLAEIPSPCGDSYFGHRGELLGYVAWAGATRGGSRAAAVYVTGGGGESTEQAMLTLVGQELCRPAASRP
ncbi:serine hydrolase domain-containing protein [Streptomyces longispororuber]|uniref:serine hydrolase domain-containing protein n=1 Tax=Streptomyces longispororuber TaxID=68230 RepID=UPI00210CAE8B|nr:serine hydrolase domain-containing protein [Streptomyces longispororuber]MCQ4207387.1 beta-lactamase family protein [Streptomyces longispororuber]